MSDFFEKYDKMGAIEGAKAFRKDVLRIQQGKSTIEDSTALMTVAYIMGQLERMNPIYGDIKDKGFIIYEAAQNMKIAEELENET